MRKGYTTLRKVIRGLSAERQRVLFRARMRNKHLFATYGYEGQQFADKMWCRRTNCCTDLKTTFKRKYRDHRMMKF